MQERSQTTDYDPDYGFGLITSTEPMLHSSNSGQTTPNSVIPYLTQKLSWRIQMPDGGYLDASNVQSLKVSVSAAEVTIPRSDGAKPDITGWQTYYDITNKKPGGLCYGEPA
ncbi:hypothetical protein ABW21_db0204237 [Orbilia brochopaga]|nr:hypothetical protein ABW21_db0204237 [Drechslerella brochopaga]